MLNIGRYVVVASLEHFDCYENGVNYGWTKSLAAARDWCAGKEIGLYT